MSLHWNGTCISIVVVIPPDTWRVDWVWRWQCAAGWGIIPSEELTSVLWLSMGSKYTVSEDMGLSVQGRIATGPSGWQLWPPELSEYCIMWMADVTSWSVYYKQVWIARKIHIFLHLFTSSKLFFGREKKKRMGTRVCDFLKTFVMLW